MNMETQIPANQSDNTAKWLWTFKLAGIAAIVNIAIIPIQIIVFIISPPPTNIMQYFILFENNSLVALIN